MGFISYGNPFLAGPSVTTEDFVATGPVASGASIGMPLGGVTGDEIWIIVHCFTQGAITPSAGWTRVGSDFAPTGCGQVAVFKKAWVAGITATMTTPGSFSAGALLMRTTSAYTVVQDTTGTGTGASAVIPASNPSDQNNDLRLVMILSDNASQAGSNYTWVTQVPTADNIAGRGYKEGYFQSLTSTKGCTLHHSLWALGANGDSGTNTVAMGTGASGTTKWGVRVITLTDGSGVNGSTPSDEAAIFMLDPNVQAVAVEEEGSSSLSAAAGIFGGGAHIV